MHTRTDTHTRARHIKFKIWTFQHVQAVKNHKTVTHTHTTRMRTHAHVQAHTEFSLLRRLQLLLN